MTTNESTQSQTANHTDNKNLTLVLGGTGKTGRRIADRLAAEGVPTRIGSRSATPPFDWDDLGTWAAALDGVESVYVSFYPDLAVPGASDTIGALAEAAAAAGVRRIVLLSGRGEKEAELSEQAVQQAGCAWTIVRASWFSQNFSEGAMLEPVLAGEVALPVGGVLEPFVDADDIADVAVAALTAEGDEHAGQVYEVTGPRLLSFAEVVQTIADAAGREIAFVPITIDEYTAALAEYEVPADVIWLLSYLFTEVLDGRNAHLADGVQRALGRAPRDFADYARDAAATGVWNV